MPQSPICSSPESFDTGFYDTLPDIHYNNNNQDEYQLPQTLNGVQFDVQTPEQNPPSNEQNYEVKFNISGSAANFQISPSDIHQNEENFQESLTEADLDKLSELLPPFLDDSTLLQLNATAAPENSHQQVQFTPVVAAPNLYNSTVEFNHVYNGSNFGYEPYLSHDLPLLEFDVMSPGENMVESSLTKMVN